MIARIGHQVPSGIQRRQCARRQRGTFHAERIVRGHLDPIPVAVFQGGQRIEERKSSRIIERRARIEARHVQQVARLQIGHHCRHGGVQCANIKIAYCIRSYALLNLDTNKLSQALDKLENDVYPALVKLLPKKHPQVEYTKALVALCLHRKLNPKATNKYGFPATPREAQLAIIDQLEMQGQSVNHDDLVKAYQALASL